MNKQIILGLFIITVGFIVFLANANVGPIRGIIQDWWPLTIILAGVYMLWSNIRNFVWPSIIIAVGSVLLLNTLDIAHFNIGALIFPTILVGIGLSIIFSSHSSWRKTTETKGSDNINAIMSESTSKNISDDYVGGTVTAIMGSVELDVSKTIIKNQAILGVSIVMGELKLRVAEDVNIVNRTQTLLGSVDDKTPAIVKPGPTLIIEGLVLMGEVEIRY